MAFFVFAAYKSGPAYVIDIHVRDHSIHTTPKPQECHTTMPKRRRGGTPAAPRHNAPAKAAADAPAETAAAVAASDNAETATKQQGQRRKTRTRTRTASTAAVKRGKKQTDDEDAPGIVRGIPDASSSTIADGLSTIAPSPLHVSVQRQQQHSQHDGNLPITLQRLDDEYAALDAMDAILRRDLRRLQRDEHHIRRAMQLSSETLAQRREREARERDRAALERLESALMGKEEEEEEDADSDGGNGNGEGQSAMAAVDDERKLSASGIEESAVHVSYAKGRGNEEHQDDHAADMLSVSDLCFHV